jgi:ankyrin repeat protein
MTAPPALPTNEELAFINAIQTNDTNQVSSLLASGTVDLHARLPVVHQPALVLAACCGHAAMAELLLNFGARIDDIDRAKQTACNAAALRGHAEVLAVLLRHAPNLELADSQQCTPLDSALKLPNAERIVVALVEAGGVPLHDDNTICEVAATGTASTQALMTRGIALSRVRASSGFTPLFYVIAYGFNPALMNMLVNVCGVDVNARDSHGNTCAHHAADRCKDAVLRWLIVAGADLECTNSLRETVLHKACTSASVSCTLLLLAAGANVHAPSDGGLTACHLAARRPRATDTMDLVHVLIAGGADVDAADQAGKTPRQILADRGFAIVPEAIGLARQRIHQLRLEQE